jgi:hypothetical protein
MDASVTPPTLHEDERIEKVVVGAAVALALVVGLGFASWKAGWLDGLFGGGMASRLAPITAVIHQEAGGDPPRILLSGSVADAATVQDVQKALQKAFPAAEVRNAIRVDARSKDRKRDIIRVSFAADAPNEAWPRARFGQVKRLEALWKDERVTLRGAVFAPATKQALEDAFARIATDARGSIQIREVVRSLVPAAQLQNDVSVAAAGRAVVFDKDGAIDGKDAASTAVLDAVAPLLKDLRGLEVRLAAGADDREVAMKQAEAVKAALVARGADGAGIRPMPAMRNNPLAFIVVEKE